MNSKRPQARSLPPLLHLTLICFDALNDGSGYTALEVVIPHLGFVPRIGQITDFN